MIQRKHTQLIQGGNIVMKIYTSYFAMMRNFPENIIPIAICAKPPTWYEGLVYKKLAPSYDILMQYKTQPNEELCHFAHSISIFIYYLFISFS